MKKKTWGLSIAIILVTIIYFSYNITLGYDSSHYVWLAEMFTSNLAFENWQPIRSFVFPLGIHILNTLFGKNETSLLIGTYTFYLIMVIAAWYMYYRTIQKNEKNRIIKAIFIFLFVILVMFNPIIFGFYHVLLTEFAAITITILMCYLAWNWMEMDFKESRLKYSIYTIVFSILTICSWHLKQPYILTTIAPLLTAIIFSIIKKHTKRNVIQRLITLLICVLALIISIVAWNWILKIKKVKVEVSDSSEGLIGRLMIDGISTYRRDPNKQNYTKESIEKDTRLLEEDRQKILSILDGESEKYQGFMLLDRGTYMNPIGNRKVVYTKEKDVSVGEGLGFIKDTLITEPKDLFSSYLANYLAIADVYDVGVTIDYGNYYYINKVFDWNQDTEITFLGYCTYRDNWNALDLPDFYIDYSRGYISVNKYIKCVNAYMLKLLLPAKISFKIILVALPFLLIIKLITYFVTFKRYNSAYKRMNELILILYIYAFIQMMMYTCLCAIMDRYAIAPYTATIIGMILDAYTMIRRKKYRNIEEVNHEKSVRDVQENGK